MKSYVHLAICLSLSAVLTACGTFTRTETDTYTITKTDTTITERVTNAPGERDNGVVYPSSRTTVITRNAVQYDSTEERYYPNFIRFGLFEGVSLLGSAIDGAQHTNAGMFGVFPDIDQLLFRKRDGKAPNGLFSGAIYRFGITEWRLRWFDDQPGWSWGITAFEMYQPDADTRHWLMGAGVLTLHKRFYLKRTIPYVSITPQASFALAPSQYINLATSADIGSIGGLNLRAYAGFTFGSSPQATTGGVMFPYAGFGVSVLDFLNREEELETEWKYHEHSAWEINVADITFVGSNSKISLFSRTSDETKQPIITGMLARVATATIALPFLDYRLAVGTSLVNFVAPGDQAFGLGVLPLRVEYIWHPTGNTLMVEPFLEYNYAPSQFVHLGIKASVPIENQISLHAALGYVSGSTMSTRGFSVSGNQGKTPGSFDAIYFGFGASFLDRLFGRNELRYGKGYPHE